MIAEAVGLGLSNHRTKSPNTEGVTFQHQLLVKWVMVPASLFDPSSRSYCSLSSAQNSLTRSCLVCYWSEQTWAGFAWWEGGNTHITCSPSSDAMTLEEAEHRNLIHWHKP